MCIRQLDHGESVDDDNMTIPTRPSSYIGCMRCKQWYEIEHYDFSVFETYDMWCECGATLVSIRQPNMTINAWIVDKSHYEWKNYNDYHNMDLNMRPWITFSPNVNNIDTNIGTAGYYEISS